MRRASFGRSAQALGPAPYESMSGRVALEPRERLEQPPAASSIFAAQPPNTWA